MIRADTRLFMTAMMLLLVAGLGALFLAWIGIDALEGRNDFQFFADSETYRAMARGELAGVDEPADLITLASNFLGPVLLLQVVGHNHYLMLLLNMGFLFFAVSSIAKSLKLDVLLFTLLLLANPLTISSVLSVNKEIISLVVLALFVRAYTARSVAVFLCALVVSVLVRWELTLFLLIFAAIASPLNPLRRHRVATLFVLLLGMSALYVALSFAIETVLSTLEMASDENQGSGVMNVLTAVQAQGGYFLVFPFKALHMLFALGLRVDRLLAPTDIYNDIWQLLHSTMTLVIFIALCRKRRFQLRNDLIYISVIYMAIFAISPVYSPRYFYPVYALWVAVLVGRTPGVVAGPSRRRVNDPARAGSLALAAGGPTGAVPGPHLQ